MEFTITNPLSDPSWDKHIAEFQDAVFFHSSAWTRVLSESYGYEPIYIVGKLRNCTRLILPLMEIRSVLTGRRAVGLPFSDYCPPLTDGPEGRDGLLEFLVEIGRQRGWRYVEIRGNKIFPEQTTTLTTYVLHQLKLLPDHETVFKTFRKGTKSTIKKALREDIRVQLGSDTDSMMEFYRLNCLTRKMHGVPPQPFCFFESVLRHVMGVGKGSLFLAFIDDRCIAGGIFFEFNGNVIYKYGASDRQNSGLGANNLILWEAIRYYAERGSRTLCFGRTSTKNTGLIRFKSGWGTKESTIPYFRIKLKNLEYVSKEPETSSLVNKVYSRIPVNISKRIGSLVYRHIG